MRVTHLGLSIATSILVGAAGSVLADSDIHVAGVKSPTEPNVSVGIRADARAGASPAPASTGASTDLRSPNDPRALYGGSAEEDEEVRRGYRPGGPAWDTRRDMHTGMPGAPRN